MKEKKDTKIVNEKNSSVNESSSDTNKVPKDKKASVKKEGSVSNKKSTTTKKRFNLKRFFSFKICGISIAVVWFLVMSYYVFTLMQFKSTIIASLQKIDKRLELLNNEQSRLADVTNENLKNAEDLNKKIFSRLDGASDERKALYRKITQLGSDDDEVAAEVSEAEEEAIFGKAKQERKVNRSHQKRYINKKNEAVIRNFMGFMKASGKSVYLSSKNFLTRIKEKLKTLSGQ